MGISPSLKRVIILKKQCALAETASLIDRTIVAAAASEPEASEPEASEQGSRS